MYIVNGRMNGEIYQAIDNLINSDEMPEIEFSYFSGMAEINNKQGKITTVKFLKDELKGNYYDEKYDIEESGKVALATDTFINILYGTDLSENIKNIDINGKNYIVKYINEQFIDGMEAMVGLVLVRFSYNDFISNIQPVNEVIIIFEKRLNNRQKKIFKNEIQKVDSEAEIVIQPKETSNQKNYKLEVVIDTVLLLSALLCLIEIYEYILNKRKKEFVVYRICGAIWNFIPQVLIVEILLLTVTSFFVGTVAFLTLWYFTEVGRYIYFDINTWFKAFFVVLCCMGAVAFKLMMKLNKSSLITLKKEAMIK